MSNRKRIVIPIVFMLLIGSSLLSNNTLENARPVDMVQLVALGVLLGILIANLKSNFAKKKQG